jgi:uncharacterized protein
MSTILITGGSGLVGTALTQALHADRHTVRWLSRQAGRSGEVQRFAWDPLVDRLDEEALVGVDHIVHLSGSGIADKRWTDERMNELHASRGGAARLLLKAALRSGHRPQSFITASGIGYYGAVTSDHVFTESDAAANDALGRLTKDWEDAADEWASLSRVVKVRTPVVLAQQGGALRKLAAPVRLGLGAALGSGDQWMPWVHIDDLVRIYQQAIADERMQGAYNANAPEQPSNRDLMRATARVLKRPFFLPNVPAFALRLALGELSAILLEGSRANNQRLLDTGFDFHHAMLESALMDTLR